VRHLICTFARYSHLDPSVLTADAIYDTLVSAGYTNTTKHPLRDTTSIITPQSLYPENLLPTITPLQNTTLLLIAEPKDSTTTLLTYHHLTQQIYTYSPSSRSLELSTPSTNIALRRRYVAVQKAHDAGAIGIIIGTLGKQGYKSAISHLRNLILSKGKKPYLLALGKLNPAKLANFTECEVFVMFACPQSTVIDTRVRKLL
jgi:diphthamide biosynthesis protein 2